MPGQKAFTFNGSDMNSGSEKSQPDSLEQLYEKHWQDLCVHVRANFGMGPPDPEDVAQTAFAKFAALDHPEEIDNPRAYLWRMAHNIVISHKRHEKTQTNYASDPSHEILGAEGDDLTAERVLIEKERYAIVRQTLEKMPRFRRRVLLLNRVHQLSAAEIARRMRVPVTTVKTNIYRAVEELEAALKAADSE